MLVVVATVAVAVVLYFVRIDRVEEPTQPNKRSVRDAHQKNGDARRPPSQVGEVSLHLVMVGLIFCGLQRRNFSFGGIRVGFCLFVGFFCVVVFDFRFVVSDVLDVGHTNAHRSEGKDADGEEDPADEDGAHPHAVLDVCFATAHSSAPLVSAVQSFSFRVGPSCL